MICRSPQPMSGWLDGSVGQWVSQVKLLVGLVGQWVGLGQITKNLINLDLIKMIQFCWKIYDLYRHPHPWVGGWVG